MIEMNVGNDRQRALADNVLQRDCRCRIGNRATDDLAAGRVEALDLFQGGCSIPRISVAHGLD